MNDLDRTIHEPVRLMIVALLSGIKEADFLFLQKQTGLTKGNLSSYLMKLEKHGYIEIRKSFRGKVPWTIIRLTRSGRSAFNSYKKKMQGMLGGAGGSIDSKTG